MEKVEWFIGGQAVGGSQAEPDDKEKIKHIKALPIIDGMSAGQKQVAEDFNLMRQTLLDKKLMKSR